MAHNIYYVWPSKSDFVFPFCLCAEIGLKIKICFRFCLTAKIIWIILLRNPLDVIKPPINNLLIQKPSTATPTSGPSTSTNHFKPKHHRTKHPPIPLQPHSRLQKSSSGPVLVSFNKYIIVPAHHPQYSAPLDYSNLYRNNSVSSSSYITLTLNSINQLTNLCMLYPTHWPSGPIVPLGACWQPYNSPARSGSSSACATINNLEGGESWGNGLY